MSEHGSVREFEDENGVWNIVIDPGNGVICDWSCNGDWTDSDVSGGIQFGSKAVCPDCAPELEASARKNGEAQYIRGRCPEGMSFADWVRNYLR